MQVKVHSTLFTSIYIIEMIVGTEANTSREEHAYFVGWNYKKKRDYHGSRGNSFSWQQNNEDENVSNYLTSDIVRFEVHVCILYILVFKFLCFDKVCSLKPGYSINFSLDLILKMCMSILCVSLYAHFEGEFILYLVGLIFYFKFILYSLTRWKREDLKGRWMIRFIWWN